MFDFTSAMESLIRHIVGSCPELGHVRPEQMIISYIQTRAPGPHGVYASVQPLRFEGGSLTTERRKKTYVMPRLTRGDRDMLYIVYFALPRFIDLDFDTKVTTVFHELYHISPEFNGDIRRFPGKKFAHGYSRKRYNEQVKVLADAYLSAPGAEEHTAFLRLDFQELTKQYGGVTGRKTRPPRPVPVTREPAP